MDGGPPATVAAAPYNMSRIAEPVQPGGGTLPVATFAVQRFIVLIISCSYYIASATLDVIGVSVMRLVDFVIALMGHRCSAAEMLDLMQDTVSKLEVSPRVADWGWGRIVLRSS